MTLADHQTRRHYLKLIIVRPRDRHMQLTGRVVVQESLVLHIVHFPIYLESSIISIEVLVIMHVFLNLATRPVHSPHSHSSHKSIEMVRRIRLRSVRLVSKVKTVVVICPGHPLAHPRVDLARHFFSVKLEFHIHLCVAAHLVGEGHMHPFLSSYFPSSDVIVSVHTISFYLEANTRRSDLRGGGGVRLLIKDIS